jgi:hypothetical protein
MLGATILSFAWITQAVFQAERRRVRPWMTRRRLTVSPRTSSAANATTIA